MKFCGKLINCELNEPVKSYFWAAGFSFSRGNIVHDVPYDSNLEYLFFGEEILMTVRLFTNGYKIYAPHQVLIYHLWNRNYRNTFWENEKNPKMTTQIEKKGIEIPEIYHSIDDPETILKKKSLSKQRLNELLFKGKLVGNVKTIKDYENESGISFEKRLISEKAKFGGFDKRYII